VKESVGSSTVMMRCSGWRPAARIDPTQCWGAAAARGPELETHCPMSVFPNPDACSASPAPCWSKLALLSPQRGPSPGRMPRPRLRPAQVGACSGATG
jgi:hypothetical protein